MWAVPHAWSHLVTQRGTMVSSPPPAPGWFEWGWSVWDGTMDKVDLAFGTVSDQDGGGMRDVEHRGMGTLVGVKNPYKWEICLSMEKLGVTVWIEIEVVKT